MWLYGFRFRVEGAYNCLNISGTFCVDSGDFTDDVYDWLFEPKLPFGGPYCLDVKDNCCKGVNVAKLNCPEETLNVSPGYEINWDFSDAQDQLYSKLSGPGAVDMETGLWSFRPSFSDSGLHMVEVSIQYGFENCRHEEYCQFNIFVENQDFGDVNSDGTVNLLDITYLISYVYNGGPAPEPYEIGDLDSSGAINILDITTLVNYIYTVGP